MTRAISFMLIPLYTRFIVPDDYGRVDIIYYTVSVLVSLIFMEVWTSFLKFGLENRDKTSVSKVFTNVVILSLLAMVPYILIQSLITFFLGTEYIVLSVIYGISLLLMNVYQIHTRIMGESKSFVVSGVLNSITQVFVALFSIFVLGINATTMLLAPITGALVAVLFLEINNRLLKEFDFKLFDKKLMIILLRFSVPLAFNSVAYWAITNFNRYYAAYHFGYREASFLSVVNKVTLVLALAGSIYSLAWQESAFEQSGNKNRVAYYSNMFSSYLALFTAATVVLMTLFNLLFPILIGHDYIDAKLLLVPSFLITYFSGIAGFFGQIFNAEKLTRKLMISTLSGFVINILALIFLIRFFDLIIVPVTTAVGFGFVSLFRISILKRNKLIQIKSQELILSLVFIGIISILNFFTSDNIPLLILLFASIVLLTIIYKDYLRVLKNIFTRRD